VSQAYSRLNRPGTPGRGSRRTLLRPTLVTGVIPNLLETSVPGVFVCGDVRLSPVERVAGAGAEGSMAIALVRQYLAS